MIQMDGAIAFRNVNYEVDGRNIIEDVTGTFHKGGITTVVGPSGAGKSTAFRLCNGLRSATSGDITIEGMHIRDYAPIELRRIVGIALQQATMITGSVRENLELPRTLRNMHLTQEEAEEYIDVVGLGKEYLDRDSKDLSGGQKQKLSIARTLVNRPKILLLDEITSSLDRISTQEIEELIVHINRKYETTVIWITHHLEQAMRIGTHAWVMMDGTLIESGTTEVLKNPTDERVRQFIKGEVE
ncbi:YbbL ABC transporter ATP-binding protein [Geomicrobium sp. JCM 19037]|nr:YbbL ABC transporter ATP-binding protein [Geomicrobium sp. JCM 19037]